MQMKIEVVTRTERTLTLPKWMQLAIEGQKLAAIKMLRDDAGLYTKYAPYASRQERYMALTHAKNIVEHFMEHISERTIG